MKVQKRFMYGEKSKAWNREKRTQVPVTEGLAVTGKG